MNRQEEAKQPSSGGSKFGVIGVLMNYGLGRIAPGFAVKRLIRALGSPNEETKMAAYMALVKLGPRNADRLLTAARQGQRTAGIVQLLGDLGDRGLISELDEFTRSSDPKVAAAARDSIDLLQSADDTK
jgi:HEAT repeat protein